MAQAMRKNLTGGPSLVFHHCQLKGESLVFHHCQLKGETLFRDNEGNIMQTITGFDANALYLLKHANE